MLFLVSSSCCLCWSSICISFISDCCPSSSIVLNSKLSRNSSSSSPNPFISSSCRYSSMVLVSTSSRLRSSASCNCSKSLFIMLTSFFFCSSSVSWFFISAIILFLPCKSLTIASISSCFLSNSLVKCLIV